MRMTFSARYTFLLFSLIFLDYFTARPQGAANLKADPKVNLVYKDTLTLPSFHEFDLPVRITSGYNVSAISLGFYFPQDYLQVDSMEMFNGTQGYYFNISDSLFNMAWSSIQPLNLNAGDTVIKLKMKSLDLSSSSNTLRLEIYEFSEFADESAAIIDGVVLEIPEIKFLVPDPGDSIAGNYVSIYPNPFKDNTTIYFDLKYESQVKISVFNPAGVELNMFEEKTYPEGHHQVKIDGLDLAKGIYLLKFEIRNSEASGEKLFKLFSIK
jgi:hypothetical protein